MNTIILSFSLIRHALIGETNKENMRYASITKTGTESFLYKMSIICILIIHYSTRIFNKV